MSYEMFQNPEPKSEGSVLAGFFLGLGPGLIINLLSGCASLAAFRLRFPVAGLIGGIVFGQLLFTFPFYRHFRGKGKFNTARGLISARL